MKKGLGISAVVITVSIALLFFFWPLRRSLTLSTVKKGEVIWCAEIGEGEEFVLSFIHSVNKRPVFDTIRVTGDHFIIVASRYDSFGAGMPEAPTGGSELKIDRDGWLIWTVNRPVSEVSFFVGWVANHTLHVRGRDIDLLRLVEAGTLVSLRSRKVSLYDLWKGRCLQ